MRMKLRAAVAGVALAVTTATGCTVTWGTPLPPPLDIRPAAAPVVPRAPVVNTDRQRWGVNTHVGYASYRDRLPAVRAALTRLHVIHVRDNSPDAPRLLPGFRVQFVLDTDDEAAALARVKTALDGGAAAIELRNEPDYSGTRDRAEIDRVVALNRKVIAYVDSRSPNTPIVASGLGLPRNEWPALLAAPPGQDYGNLHIYRGGNVSDAGWRSWRAEYLRYNLAGAKRWMVTETGTHDDLAYKGGHVPTPNDVAASRIVSDFRSLIADGATRVFTYELLDEGKPGPQGAFGLYEEDGVTMKPQAVAMAKALS